VTPIPKAADDRSHIEDEMKIQTKDCAAATLVRASHKET
jgi:hypothetical protein